jgi:hypothetical protein
VQQAREGPISGQDPSRARVRYAIVRELLSTLLRNHLFVKMCAAPHLLAPETRGQYYGAPHIGGNIWSGVQCFFLQELLFTCTPPGDCMASGCDASTSTRSDHRAGINHVGLCRPHYLDVRLLCPPGHDVPRRVRCSSERTGYLVVAYARVGARGVRATAIASCRTCCPGAHTSTEDPLCLCLVLRTANTAPVWRGGRGAVKLAPLRRHSRGETRCFSRRCGGKNRTHIAAALY